VRALAVASSFAPTDDHPFRPRLRPRWPVRRRREPGLLRRQHPGRRDKRARLLGRLAHLRGRDGGDRLRGLGLDIGATYRFAGRLQPSLTLAYAYGSGDPDPSVGVDRQFRQTGLQDNTYRFNGVENFRYYGETLNPDLSNLEVFTAGIGIRPTERSSIDLTHHLYRQDEAAAGRIPGARVIAETNGESRDIGHGLNMNLGYHDIEDVRLRAKLGWFTPGDAFDASDDAFSIESGIEVAF
jgi:alginate production protein